MSQPRPGEQPPPPTPATDPLPSWTTSSARVAIEQFVAVATDPTGPGYVAPFDRLAIFDHDGTLWCEKPLPIHFYAIFDRLREQAAEDRDGLLHRIWHALTTRDDSYFDEQHWWGELLEPAIDVLGTAFSGMDDAAYAAWMCAWLERWRHPRLGVGVAGLVYEPMRELVAWLQANDFTVAISTADEADFVQLVSQSLYGIAPELVLGSTFAREERLRDGMRVLVRTYHPDHADIGVGKRLSVAGTLGKQPVFVAGNMDSDLGLLEWAQEREGASLSLLVSHTDAAREFAYTRGAKRALATAEAQGWPIVDMRQDWRTIFPSPDGALTRNTP